MHVRAGTRFKPRPCFRMNFQSLALSLSISISLYLICLYISLFLFSLIKEWIPKEISRVCSIANHKLFVQNGSETIAWVFMCLLFTVCPSSSDPFYIVSYYIKWVTTSWTHSISLCHLKICSLTFNWLKVWCNKTFWH